MNTPPITCPDCGATLPAGASPGPCAACLLKLAEQTEVTPTVLQAVPLTEDAGARIGRYQLLEPLGEGGFGTVWMAEQEEPVRRRVALKLLKLGMDTRAVVARFEAERQALALMDHPHIAKVLDGGATETGRPYFVMELVRGVPITDYCDTRRLTARERLELFIPVCQAVQHAHQKGIIHRDLKPSNILVTEQDGHAVPKVIDFGIAKATEQKLTEKTLFTRLHQMIGTPAYMSPEQAGLGGLDIDTRSDVYSLGVLLYELLTGRTPFDNRKLMEAGYDAILQTIREVDPPRPSTRLSTLTEEELTTIAARRGDQPARLNKLLRGELDWIVLKALEKDRNRRYETANDLATDLRRHLESEPVTAVAPSAAYRLKKWAGRNRLVVIAGSVVTVALLAGLGTSLWSLQRERVAKQDAVAAGHKERQARTAAEQAQAAVSVERDRAARLLSVSQAEQGVRLLGQGDPVGLLHLVEARITVEHLPEERIRRTLLWSSWINSLPKPAVRVLTPPPGSGAVPDPFSGRPPAVAPRPGLPWTATGSTNGEVALWEAGSGRLLTRFSTGSQRVAAPELSADGRLLVVNVNGNFQLWDLAPVRSNQPPRRLLGRISRIAFDPPHARVLTLANQGMPLPGESPDAQPAPGHADGFQVQIWDSSAEPPLTTTWEGNRDDLANHQFAFSADGSRVAAAANEITLWDARSGQRVPTTLSTETTSRPRDMFDPFWFSPDGRWLWEVRRMACLRYDLSTGQLAGEPITGLHRFQRPWLAEDGRHLVVSLTNGFQVFHLDRGEPMGPTIAADDDTVRALALRADGLRLATAGPDRALRVWDTTTGRQSGPTLMPPMVVNSASFSPDGKWLDVRSHSLDIDLQGGSTTVIAGPARSILLAEHPPTWFTNWASVRVIGFRSDGELLTYRRSEGTMAWRDPATGRSSFSWSVPGGRDLIGAALNPRGTLVAAAFKSAEKESEIRLWDAATGRLREPPITWTNQGVLAFSPDGQTLAGLGGYDGSGSIQLWDVGSGQPRAFFPSPPKQVSWLALRFSPDGRFLAARNSYAISVWDVAAGRLATGGEIDFYLAISDDWKWAVGQELLDFTDPRNPRPAPHPLKAASGPASRRAGLALSPDGKLRVATAADRELRLWDNLTERPVGHAMGVASPMPQASFSPDGRLLAVFDRISFGGRAGAGMNLRLWDTSTGLPCGPAVPLNEMTVELLFDREVRWLTQKAPFDTRETLVIQLPDRDLPLAEMERQSWLLSGCRLDEAGNVEVIPDAEFRQLESGQPHKTAAAVPTPPTPSLVGESAALPTGSTPASSSLPAAIRDFIHAQEHRARALAAQQNRPLPPALTHYFHAARAGDWNHASNAYASFSRQIDEGPLDGTSALLFLLRQPALDSYIALQHFSRGSPRFSTDFGRRIVASLPAGSIYFGGTDAGRGLVTAFGHARTNADAIFVLTQNALADNSYLDYVRDAYGKHIHLPTAQDSQSAFGEYLADAQRRLEHDQQFPAEPRQIKPGENIQTVGGRVQVSGHVAVMTINALLAKRIVDLNPEREVYVEESSPLEWMRPHLAPHGVVLKLSRQPLPELTPAIVDRDRAFWIQLLRPLVGEWPQEETSPIEVARFIERVYVRKDLEGFAGDPAFVTDPLAPTAFARPRASIAALYRWRAQRAREGAERARMLKAADFAFRQSVALCPYAPEVVDAYIAALLEDGRAEDARSIAAAVVRFPQTKLLAERTIRQLEAKR